MKLIILIILVFKIILGIISIKPQNENHELPMDPITMMRNALGVEHGGSGVGLIKEKYMESVNFWAENARIR